MRGESARLVLLVVIALRFTISSGFIQHLSSLARISLLEMAQEDDDTSPQEETRKRFRSFRDGARLRRALGITRVLLLSDVHTDYEANRKFLGRIAGSDGSDGAGTMIIIAGDVSHDLEYLRWTLRKLRRHFDMVVYTPGNHELWLDKGRRQMPGKGDGCSNSIEKLEKVLELCIDEDICIGPVQIGDVGNELLVLPLLSWHHQAFDTEPAIDPTCWSKIPNATKVIVDYRRTSWPGLSALDVNDSVAEYIDSLNDSILDMQQIKDALRQSPMSLLTVSHFLPRIELIPEKRYLTLPTLHSCVGSVFLEERVRALHEVLRPRDNNVDGDCNHMHAFGHSHLSWDAVHAGIRYVHSPLAYPKEWEYRRGSLEIGSMRGESSDKRYPVSIWEANKGFPSHWLGGWWSRYYSLMPRRPERTKYLAPWVARRYQQQEDGIVEEFDHLTVEKALSFGSNQRDSWKLNNTNPSNF